MHSITLSEHERLYRWDKPGEPPTDIYRQWLSAKLYRRLQRFDEQLQRQHKNVFDWHVDYVKAQQWVGVIQIGSLRIEILPKVDAHHRRRASTEEGRDSEAQGARENLLYMLSVAGDVPLRARDIADLAKRKAPLSEHLISAFASHLQEELLKGVMSNYQRHDSNLGVMRGKLSMSKHIKKNSVRRDRFYCEYDEFTADNFLNQVFKYCCDVLLDLSHSKKTLHKLRHCLLILDDVSNITMSIEQLKRVHFTRQNERFKSLFSFCELLIEGFAPIISAGNNACFTLLFDMNEVFERFIAAFMKKHLPEVHTDLTVIPQAKNQKIHLLKHGDKGRLLLKPDILISRNKKPVLIIDTKWKALTTGTQNGRGGVSRDDLYQMHAYSQRFGVTHSTLLYPMITGEQAREFEVINEVGQHSGKTISVRYVNISRRFDKAGQELLKAELAELVAELLPVNSDITVPGALDVG